ncbi:MAG: cupin domain-containing protein [Gammaproteobacteria bacterium]|nr:cupin domain-containing protein [Gammaproteobacteria bacterium]MBI5616144.1 cupin domain-containing protein [Gammaproteobacteria bacterium]
MFIHDFRKIATAIALATLAGIGPAASRADSAAPGKISASTLKEVELGELPPGKWSMKSTLLVIEPGAKIPMHAHRGPGLRYVLEGAITISWKEGKQETFKAGDTYFEGTGVNHPAGNFSASNDGSVPCRVVIVELVPK